MTPPPSRFGAARLALILTTVCMIFISPASTRPGNIHVRSDQSIQAAIHKAHSGDRILVEHGTYPEQLTIDKDGISLIGHGATLVPPNPPTHNDCSGLAGPDTQVGICVIGSGVVLADFVPFDHRKVLSVEKPVKDVSITGFEVSGFSGVNIAVVGAKNARVTGNKLRNGGAYGALTVGSKNSRIADNTVVSSGMQRFIGICMDDRTDGRVSNNHISGYFFGLCVQTSGAEVSRNDVSNGCLGAFVDPGVKDAKLRYNHFSATDPTCPPFSAIGITLSGAVNTKVRHNIVRGQRDVGVAVVDDPSGVKSSGNVVAQNTLSLNGVDLFLETTDTSNIIKRNKCSKSSPDGLCASK